MSYEEAKKIIKFDFYDEALDKEEDFNWICHLLSLNNCDQGYEHGDNIPDLIKVLEEWKINPPSKEILKDLKDTINNHQFKILGSHLRTICYFVANDLCGNERVAWRLVSDENLYKLTTLLFYFGMKTSEKEIEYFKSKINNKISRLNKFVNMFKNF